MEKQSVQEYIDILTYRTKIMIVSATSLAV